MSQTPPHIFNVNIEVLHYRNIDKWVIKLFQGIAVLM